MSSDPPAEPPTRRSGAARRFGAARRGAPRSLRAQVLGILIGLLTIGFVLVGTVTAVALHRFQVDQLDDRLSAAGKRFSGANDHRQPPDDRPYGPGGGHQAPETPESLFPPGQVSGTLSARVVGGRVTLGAVLDGSTTRSIPDAQKAVLAALPVDPVARTRDLGPLGGYRLIATRGPSGEVLVTGLPMAEVDAARYELIAVEVGVGLVALLIAVVGGAVVVRVALAPLSRVAATAARVSELTLHEGEVALAERVPPADTDPGTEVGQVGAALNRMLDHVGAALSARQASETRLRRFVADASHELRTPLATIRGYTELTRRYRPETPPAVGTALDRVEAAAGRMTTLVEDLLLLARLDAKRPLDGSPVDLAALVVEAVADAHVAGPAHRWRLDLPEEPVTVVGDAVRLHQVVTNLLANARTHTPPGTTVTAGLSAGGGYATVWVADDGPGIPPEVLPRVFERFARGDDSRSRASGSSGLGLAIVDAVVAAHGGSVAVDSSPAGTRFTVRLPVPDSQVTPSKDQQSKQPDATPLPA